VLFVDTVRIWGWSIVLGFGNGFLWITSAELYKLVGISFSNSQVKNPVSGM